MKDIIKYTNFRELGNEHSLNRMVFGPPVYWSEISQRFFKKQGNFIFPKSSAGISSDFLPIKFGKSRLVYLGHRIK